MRIEGPQGPFGDSQSKDRVAGKKGTNPTAAPSSTAPPSFVEELQGAMLGEAKEDADFDKLIAEVDEEGRQLVAHPDEQHLKSYREAVKKFLIEAVRRAYRVRVVEGRGPNPKLYVCVEKVENKLEELARAVLDAQKQPLRILADVEELRGLLLDLKT